MSNGRKIILLVALALIPLMSADAEPSLLKNEDPIRFGVLPFIPAGVLEYRFRALVQALSEALDQPVLLESRAAYAPFREALSAHEFDIALVQPWDYMAVREKGYTGLVQKGNPLRGVFVTNDDSLTNVSQLQGKTVAFPDQMAAVTLTAKQRLMQAGIEEDDYQAVYHRDHQSCMLAVANRSVDACVVGERFGETSREQVGRNYRVFGYTAPSPPILVIIGPKLRHLHAQLQRWFLSLHDTKTNQAILDNAYLDNIIAMRDSDYIEWFESLQ
ncbi:hypothetical protein NBRC116494_03190 [Aurantivibrio plasticivorans]